MLVSKKKNHFTFNVLVFLLICGGVRSFPFQVHMLRRSITSLHERTTISPVCQRIPSHEASNIIKRSYDRQNVGDKRSTLLIITSDASRGANRHVGVASVIREIGGFYDDRVMEAGNNLDIVSTSIRRTRPLFARDIFQSEVAALSLGIKTAIQNVPIMNRKRVLLLTDSQSAINFFCGDKEGIRPPNVDHKDYKAMKTLLHDSEEIYMAKVRSAKLSVDGFFDHDASDILSSFVKTISNKNKESLSKISVLRIPCHPLRPYDLDYLENSAILVDSDKSMAKKTQALLKKDSYNRQQRCKNRMNEEFGIELE